MKKVFKVTGKIVKWYLIANTIVLAYIGSGEVVKELRKHPEDSNSDRTWRVFERATKRWKKCINE